MPSTDNKTVLDNGFKKGLDLIYTALRVSLHWSAVELVHTALANREYTGFTGNTQTSYTCGIYLNGVLIDVVSSQDQLPRPVRRKIELDKTVFLKHPYEGSERARTGQVKVNRISGAETALKFINKYRAPRKGLAIVMTTGTEYSEFLEEMCDLDVLTQTFKDAKNIMAKNWRRIP